MQEHPKPEHPDNPAHQDDEAPKGPPVKPRDGGHGPPPHNDPALIYPDDAA